LWDLRLVDPDNRGPIDFARRASALAEISKGDTENAEQALRGLVEQWHDGKIKLYLLAKALGFRRDHADLFHEGEFVPLQTTGCHAENVIAFLRRTPTSSVLAVMPRWLCRIVGKTGGRSREIDWCDTQITLPSDSAETWKSILSPSQVRSQPRERGACLMLSELFRQFPVAFFEG
jgi:(1->4)-alpha-D-glucan 1-alpha-D-glucosylmutase